jgi:hypothetical protein
MERVTIEHEKVFHSIRVLNLVDKVYSSVTMYSYLIALMLLVFLSISYIHKLSKSSKFRKNALHASILVTYIFLFSLVAITYPLSKAGFRVPSDMASMRVTFLFLLPLASMLVATSFSELINSLRKKYLKAFFIVIVIVILILAPQYTHVSEVKSAYDVTRVKENANKFMILSNSLYHFVTTHTMIGSRVLSSYDYIIYIYYTLPINYKLKTRIGGYQIDEIHLYSILFNNGVYKVLITELGLVLSR